MSGSGESNPFANFVIGLLIGVGASFLYIRFGIEMPAAIGVGQRITSEAIVKTAELELFNNSNPPLVRHRALAMILANKPETFLEVDRAIGHRFLNEFLRQHQTGYPLNGPVVVNPPNEDPLTISPSMVGTTVINAGVLGSSGIRVANKSPSILRAMLQQKYPDASDEVIDFLVANPETHSQSDQTGRRAALPNELQTR